MDLNALQRNALLQSQKNVIALTTKCAELEKALAEQQEENKILYKKLSAMEFRQSTIELMLNQSISRYDRIIRKNQDH